MVDMTILGGILFLALIIISTLLIAGLLQCAGLEVDNSAFDDSL